MIGEQVNDGVETLLRGRVFDGLNVIGGVTWLDPVLQDTASAATSDKLVVSVPRWQGNLFVEYDIPQLEGPSVNANLHYTGARAANVENTTWADRLRHARPRRALHHRGGRPQADVSRRRHQCDRHALLGGDPAGNGERRLQPGGRATSVYAAFLGAPRVFHLSATAEF